ncbi:hypothetical protein, partial [Salinispora sp. H7-4]|uniref:hypothetical protein n=1 Tax=Salinispora sp. H7-4 TaxID=2748321 RepID=UPI0021078B06
MSYSPTPFAAGGSRRRLIAAAVAVGLIATSVAAIDPAAANAGLSPTTNPLATAGTAPEAHTVTLITGDIVTVRTLTDGKTLTEVEQPDDATGGFSVQQHGD